ncbi:MAG TPA: thioredoxin domain-containing protein [Vicinamibacteria bacterium]|nr:thioredoxin domain-containing protein [Vicinamibacteria bacterium]
MNRWQAAGLAATFASLAPLAVAAEKPAPAKSPKVEAASPTVATLDGGPISEAELDSLGGSRLFQARNQLYTTKRQILEEAVNKRLVERLAGERGMTAEALLKAEVTDKVAPLTEEDKKAFYEANKARFGTVAEAEALKQIGDNLPRQKENDRRREFFAEIRAKAQVKILLEPPRVAVDPTDDPALGPQDAPVTLVMFSDFQCPYCSKTAPVLHRLAEKYGSKLRIVFRDFPLLQIHKDAAKAAEAATCAAEQGKFWEMHDKLFANQGALQVDALKKRAAELGLDTAAFDGCLDSGKHTAEWQQDTADAQRYGVTGTPAAFVNGRLLAGAVPIDGYTQVIDEELDFAAAKAVAKAEPAKGGKPAGKKR